MTTPQKLLLAMMVCLCAWGLLRAGQITDLRTRVAEEESAQRRFLATLATTADNTQALPAPPKPDTATWLANQPLKPLNSRLRRNDPSAGGIGADVELQNLTPDEVLRVLQTMTKVNLIVRRLVLEDLASRGKWGMNFNVEVPVPEKNS